MRQNPLLELLLEIEARFPVERWRLGEIHLWPLVRYQLWTENDEVSLRVGKAAVAAAPAQRRLRSAARAFRGGLKRMAARAQDREGEATVGPVDCLLASDGISFIEFGGKWYERFFDPIRSELRGMGLTSLLVTPLDRYIVPRHTPSYFFQPELDTAQLVNKLTSRRSTEVPEALDGFDEAQEFALQRFPDLTFTSVERFWVIVHNIEAFSRAYEQLLARTRPRAVLQTSYYGSERMALNLACRRLGIVSVDVQHGYAGAAHWAYSHWDRVPPNGYELLPRFFWVWSELELKNVKQWSDRCAAWHQPILGGNPFMSLWASSTDPVVAQYDQLARALRASAGPAQNHVLYTLYGAEKPDELERLAQAVADSASKTHWWLRLHPVRTQQRPALETALRKAGASNFFLDESSSLPLVAILRVVDVHVSEQSFAMVEARDLGVPSVMIGPKGVSMYPELLESGWALWRADFSEAQSGIETQAGLRARLKSGMRPPAQTMRTALGQLLGEPLK